ncbi:MAG: urate hydroxylase PuuD [Acidobacteriota bacterium]|nr:urate hydroxylase PuuD [Acidobacteriota bacterium]MDQ5837466.1 urate hydroxylase PuuD [Acidobacteriota bacterium]
MRLPPNVNEWLNLLLRWFHVFSAILWVGSTYYFTWLDGRFQEEEREAGKASEVGGDAGHVEVWMVHSGGFYVVEKRKTPSLRRLHWFRWEAAMTWLSGILLLTLVYYMGGGMIDADVRNIGLSTAVLFGVGMLVVGWVVYDLLVQSPLGRNEKAFAVVAYALVVGAAYLSTHVLAGRAAYIHVGATFGTIMAANVWMRILPAQRRMIAAVKEGRAPDPSEGARAKLRSKHNTFMVVPAVFTMISNHYPVSTYGHEYNWLILSALVLVGWAAAKIIRRA